MTIIITIIIRTSKKGITETTQGAVWVRRHGFLNRGSGQTPSR